MLLDSAGLLGSAVERVMGRVQRFTACIALDHHRLTTPQRCSQREKPSFGPPHLTSSWMCKQLDPCIHNARCAFETFIAFAFMNRHPYATIGFNSDDTGRFFLASRACECRFIKLQLYRNRRPSLRRLWRRPGAQGYTVQYTRHRPAWRDGCDCSGVRPSAQRRRLARALEHYSLPIFIGPRMVSRIHR